MSGRGAQRMKNFVLDQAGNPVQRGGQALWGSAGRISSNQKIADLYISTTPLSGVVIGTPTVPPIVETVYAYSAQSIYTSPGVAGGTLEIVGPISWDEMLSDPVWGSVKAAKNADIHTRALFQSKGPFDYVSFWGASSNYLTHPKVKRLLPGFGAGGVFNMGLPLPRLNSFSGFYVSPASAAGSNFVYLYYAVFVYTYTVNSITYTERSAPRLGPTISLASAIGAGGSVDVKSTTVAASTIYGASDQCYPSSTVVSLEIYRTKANETVPYLHSTIAQGPSGDFTDTTLDANLGATTLYTVDGTAPYDEPPPCYFFHIVGDIAYYAGFFNGSGYSTDSSLQSVPGVLYSAPADFEIRAPDAISGGISSNDIYPIYFCANSIWRLEGQIDSFGNGSPIFRLITDKIGCRLPPTVKKWDRFVSFVGSDGGFYVTDGFQIKKQTDHLNRTLAGMYGDFTNRQGYNTAGQMGAAVDVRTGRTFYSFGTSSATPATNNNGIYAVDPRQDVDGGAAVTEFGGRTHETLGEIFRPQGMSFLGKSLVWGDSRGYPMIMQPEPVFSTSSPDDIIPNTAVSTSLWTTTAVVPDWISQTYDYGMRTVTKITTALTATFQLIFSQTAVAADFFSYREGKFRSDTVKTEEMQLAAVRATDINTAEQSFTAWRRLKRQGLRAVLRQFRVKKGYVVQYSSEGTGYGTAAIAGATAQLTSADWPSDVVGSYLHLEANYAQGHLIQSVSGDTLTLYNGTSLVPTSGGPFKWEIKSYPKSQWLSLLGIDVDYFPLQTPQNAPDAASNAENSRSL